MRDFESLVERHRGELRVHCYRMLGSFEEAEDLVQETFLRAWKNFGGFEGRATVRTWLYRIATNACLDALDGRSRRVLPHHVSPPCFCVIRFSRCQRPAMSVKHALGART